MLRGLPNNSNHFIEDPVELYSDYNGLGNSNDSNDAQQILFDDCTGMIIIKDAHRDHI